MFQQKVRTPKKSGHPCSQLLEVMDILTPVQYFKLSAVNSKIGFFPKTRRKT